MGKKKNEIGLYLCISQGSSERQRQQEGETEIYYKELAHTVTEAENSQDLESSSWGPRRPDMYFQLESRSLRTRRADG